MKKILFLSLLTIATLTMTNCEKQDESETGNKYMPIVITWAKYNQIDSLFYSNEKVSEIKVYRRNSETNLYSLSSSYRMDYSGSQLLIYRFRNDYELGWVENLYRRFIFEENRLSEIRNEEGRLYANYNYEGGLLKYFRYFNSEEAVSDSLIVKYDSNGDNISELKWFKYNSETSLFSLINTFNYLHDTKNNPYEGLIYHPIFYWDEEELSLDSFNSNNITTVGSYNRTYGYNNDGYPEYVDLGEDSRVYFEYRLF